MISNLFTDPIIPSLLAITFQPPAYDFYFIVVVAGIGIGMHTMSPSLYLSLSLSLSFYEYILIIMGNFLFYVSSC